MESQVWPISVGTYGSIAGTQSTPVGTTGPDHRRERLRRAVSSSAAPPGKNTTAAKAALPTLAHAGERTVGHRAGRDMCNVGSCPGDARCVMSPVASGTDAHTFTHSHAALDGHRIAHSTGCRDVRLLPALVYCTETTPRYAHAHAYTALGGHCMPRCRSVWWLPPLATVLPRLHDYAVHGWGCSCYARRRRAARPITSAAAARCAAQARDSHSVYYVAASTP